MCFEIDTWVFQRERFAIVIDLSRFIADLLSAILLVLYS